MYQRHELQNTLSQEEFVQTLQLSVLSEKEEYTEDEAERFQECLQLMEQGKSYDEVAELMQQNDIVPSASPQPAESESLAPDQEAKNGKKPSVKPLEFSELLSLTKELGCSASPKEAIKLLEACGLSSEAEQFNQEECDRFLEACDLLKNQGKTYEEIAAHFGADREIEIAADMESATEEVASILDQSGNGLVSEMMRYKAKADVSAAPFQYLGYVAEELGSPEFKENMQRVEELVKGKVEGKSQARTRRILGEMRVIPPSPSPLNALPGASEDGLTSD
ncbi:MAG: hypothetical protein JO235_25215 [Chroococcidiopsidaceae cyanobacterium CP_BM_RX_35]|nr:hypothetical protein [Chroococcidiopsidaceae cyanobacterium CP_BM_RX_35]